MLTRVVTRRMALRSTALRSMSSIDSLVTQVVGDEAKQELNRLKAALYEISALKAKFSSDPAPIDFDKYKAKLGPVVDSIKAEYESIQYPPPETVDNTKETEEFLAEAKVLIDESKAAVADLDADIAKLTAAKTGEETSVDDIYKACKFFCLLSDSFPAVPELEAEIDEEIHNHQWGKDVI